MTTHTLINNYKDRSTIYVNIIPEKGPTMNRFRLFNICNVKCNIFSGDNAAKNQKIRTE